MNTYIQRSKTVLVTSHTRFNHTYTLRVFKKKNFLVN